ncbi:dienelactone hydrolase [Peteryoungia aggregata LMG 23059]|uniref:Dienelactone hydrolase n=1 Tax=Peteryoungia aggregata LMG 23059 TaxID=1368425 RepID=A0ABU0G2W3_9HYPH|nr:dienelactone hydrolase family protein [Peteryoungia aggregata]MDQ0419062.1 dienelactone hydrolase [Peteryoungia aggregata LMG 23059]
MTIINLTHAYTDGEMTFIGRLIYDDAMPFPRAGVIVAPAFGGLGPLEVERAIDLAKLGYVALAVDYYGNGLRAHSEDEAFQLMNVLNNDRPRLAARMNIALSELKSLPQVDPSRTAAMGYCFGGKAVLDLARSGADFRAAISFHGVYDKSGNMHTPIVPSVLILHGWEDPLARPLEFTELGAELNALCDDWQALCFGKTGHAFTNPNAQSPDTGMAFNERSSFRAWRALVAFLDERIR